MNYYGGRDASTHLWDMTVVRLMDTLNVLEDTLL